MHTFSTIVALLGGLILLLALVSARLGRSPLPPSVVALLVGILVGPAGLDLVDLAELGDEVAIREDVARLTLGIGLVGVALRVPREYPRRAWRDLALLVGPGMLLMWGISTALVVLVLGWPLLPAALVGAIVTPTDPIAATPIVTGEEAEQNIPERVRHAISYESGANDGLSYLFVFLPLLWLTKPPAEALSHWLLQTALWEVGAATALGLALGAAAGWLLQRAVARGLIEADWRLIYTVALALLAIGAGRLIRSDEVLVVFAAGAAFVQVVSAEEREEEDRGQEAVNRFFAVPIFALLGIAIPWAGWESLGWRGVLLAVAVLLLRRPPVLLALHPLLREVRGVREALFVGWFGPIAVAAIYYAAVVERHLGSASVWHVVSLVTCASVVAHGLTGAVLTRRLGRSQGGG